MAAFPAPAAIDTRYWKIVALLLALALVPTAINAYGGLPMVEGRLAPRLPLELASMSGADTERNEGWGLHKVGTPDWVERTYNAPPAPEVTLFAARGYDGRPFFHFPERDLVKTGWTQREYAMTRLTADAGKHDGDAGEGEADTEAIAGDALIAHRLLLSNRERSWIAKYVLLSGDTSIGNPYAFYLRHIPAWAFGGRQPFTLVFARAEATSSGEAAEAAVDAVLREAVRFYRSADATGGADAP